MKGLVATAILWVMIPALALAQNTAHRYRGQGYLFFGLGTASDYQQAVVKHAGGGGEGFLYKGFGMGAEVGYAHWGWGFAQAWVGSAGGSYHFRRRAPRGGCDPFVLVGATGYFPTSHGDRGSPAGNFGGGVNLWLKEHTALRLEVRDHVRPGGSFGPGDHYVSFRVGVTFR